MTSIRGGNPFATRHTRPGASPYRFAPGESLDALLEQLQLLGMRGQIVGPHGSGKSTLVATLVRALREQGRPVHHVQLSSAARGGRVAVGGLKTETLIVVDGFEQCSRIGRVMLMRRCRDRRLGLLVTVHRPLRIPVLYRTGTTRDRFLQWVRQRLSGWPLVLSDEVIAACYDRHSPNLREALFDLYDRWEQAARGSLSAATTGANLPMPAHRSLVQDS